MRLSFVIALSLAANLVLGAILIRQRPTTTAVPASDTAAATVQTKPAKNPVPQMGNAGNERISWQDLQTDDLKEFIRRLRAVNCPETTVQDLVLAEVNRRYGQKLNALWPDRISQNDYWKPYKRDFSEQKRNRELFKQQRALQKEKTALLIELLGVDVERQHLLEEGLDNSNWGPWNRQTAFLPEDKRAAVQKYLEDFNEKEQDFYASIQGAWDSDTRKKQKALEQEKFAGLAQILTPEELRQYELRNSQVANQLMSDIRGVSLTEQQYEALYDIRAKYGDSIYNYGSDGNDAATIKQIEQNKKDMQAEIAGALGADTSQQLQRAQDYSYRQLSSLASHYDLPVDTAPKIYDVKQASEKAAQEVRADTNLTPDQQQAALQQIRAATEQSVNAMLGNKVYKIYMNNNGWWMNNIAPGSRK